ncbi:MAG: TonB-dependent receptor [Nitrospirae bacterium]|nr:TonB-dependent receptor [Nitrospirota bacterium]
MKKNNGKFKLITLFFCTVWFSQLAYIQSDSFSEPVSPTDEMMLFQEIPSVYSASKYEQKVTEAPSSVSIITADEIRKYGYRDFGEILESIRGFYVTNDRNYKYLGVRGFGLPSDYSNRILVLVDGIRINDNIFDAPLIGTEFPLEIDLIDYIEVVRGPSSSLYGSNAFFGVINVITKTGRGYKGVEISGEAGTFDTYKSRISYGNRYQNGLELLLSSSFFDSAGDEHLYYREFDHPGTNSGIANNSDYARYKNFFTGIKFKDFTIQGNYHSRKKGIPTASYGTIFNSDTTYTKDERSWIDVKYEHTFENRLSVFGRLNYNYYNYSGEYPYEGNPAEGEAGVVILNDSGRGKWFSGELQVSKSFTDKHRTIFGASFHANQTQVQKVSYTGASDWGRLDDRRHNDNWALFLQDEFNISEHVILNGGLRHDYYKAFGGTTNPRVALIYNPLEKTTFKAIYGRAFRAPSVYELYYNDGGVTAKANNDLKPETINTYELVYEQYIGKYLRGTVAGFYYTLNDLIKQETDPDDGLLVFNNNDDVTAGGAEFEMEGKSDSGLEGSVSYTYQKTKDKQTGRALSNSPKHLAKAHVIIPVIKEKIFLGLEELYTGRRRTLSMEKQEGLPAGLREEGFPFDRYAGSFFLTNGTLYTKNLWKTLEASASVYNLFNKKYGDLGAMEHFQNTIEQDSRTVRVKVTYAF